MDPQEPELTISRNKLLTKLKNLDNVTPLCAPEIRGNEWKYVKECLDTNWVSSVGPFVDRFEQMVADYVGTKCAVATTSGTAALHIALLVAGVQPDDEVLVSTLSFIAPANTIRYVGAWPVFMDAEPEFWQMDPEKVKDFLEKECRWSKGAIYNITTKRRVKAILPVHILGHPCPMDPLLEVARKFKLVVVEDATESLGAKYKDRMVGHLGDIACFSFNGNKIITTGGGGMIVTDNKKWAERAQYLTTQAKDDSVESIHNEIGFNYRLTNIQAAIGSAQMEQLENYVEAKRQIAATYTETFKDIPGVVPMREAPSAFSTFWMYTVLIDGKKYGRNSRALLKQMEQNGIQTRPLWQPLHRSKAHARSQAYRVEAADTLYRNALSLPSSVGLKKEDQERVIEAIRKTLLV